MKSAKLQELPHIVVERRRLENEQELTNDQFFRVTIPTHKAQEEQ
jgi:hypothetical protein